MGPETRKEKVKRKYLESKVQRLIRSPQKCMAEEKVSPSFCGELKCYKISVASSMSAEPNLQVSNPFLFSFSFLPSFFRFLPPFLPSKKCTQSSSGTTSSHQGQSTQSHGNLTFCANSHNEAWATVTEKGPFNVKNHGVTGPVLA